jgi:hypothetical protein
MSVPNATILPNKKGSKMTIDNKVYQVGDLFTTLKSKETGVIKEIIPNSSGSVRVRLETDNGERWTTVLQDNLA